MYAIVGGSEDSCRRAGEQARPDMRDAMSLAGDAVCRADKRPGAVRAAPQTVLIVAHEVRPAAYETLAQLISLNLDFPK